MPASIVFWRDAMTDPPAPLPSRPVLVEYDTGAVSTEASTTVIYYASERRDDVDKVVRWAEMPSAPSGLTYGNLRAVADATEAFITRVGVEHRGDPAVERTLHALEEAKNRLRTAVGDASGEPTTGHASIVGVTLRSSFGCASEVGERGEPMLRSPRHSVRAYTDTALITIDGFRLRYVTDVKVEHAAGGVPLVTLSFLARSFIGAVVDDAESVAVDLT